MKRLVLAAVGGALMMAAQGSESPYSGQHARELKALSQKQIDDYLKGRGMGLAKAAELNRHPGPRHVLDLADQLGLSPSQETRTEAIYEAMKAEAISIGVELVKKERELDLQFRHETISLKPLESLSAEIGTLQGKLRFVHLRAHLEQKALLTDDQIREYDLLRGYGSGGRGAHSHTH